MLGSFVTGLVVASLCSGRAENFVLFHFLLFGKCFRILSKKAVFAGTLLFKSIRVESLDFVREEHTLSLTSGRTRPPEHSTNVFYTGSPAGSFEILLCVLTDFSVHATWAEPW